MRFNKALAAVITNEGFFMRLPSWEYDEELTVREGKLYISNNVSSKLWDGTVDEFDSDKWKVYSLEGEPMVIKSITDEVSCCPSKKQMFIMESKKGNFSKVVLGIRMPDGTKEIIINDNVEGKVDYISQKYDDNLTMGGVISIEEYMFISK